MILLMLAIYSIYAYEAIKRMALVNTITGIPPEALMYPQPGDGRLCVMKVFVGTQQTLEYLLQYRNRQ